MKRYLAIYKRLLRLSFAALLAYRANFINSVISSLGWGAFSLYSVVILTTNVTSAYGWKREELLLFNGVYGVIMALFHMFVSVNMRRFSRIIHMGELDMILAKPIDSQFAMSAWLVDYSMILRVLLSIGFTVWIISTLHIAIGLSQLALFALFALSAWVLLYSIWFLVLTNIIWFTNLSNLVRLMYSFESMGRFPKEMLQQFGGFVFVFVLPIAIVINTPTRALISRLTLGDGVLLVSLALLFAIAARKYWLWALRHYASASS